MPDMISDQLSLKKKSIGRGNRFWSASRLKAIAYRREVQDRTELKQKQGDPVCKQRVAMGEGFPYRRRKSAFLGRTSGVDAFRA
jgi:hypothetical protein